MSAPIPENEEERLQALHACRILDTPPEPDFDDITLLAAQICGVPLAAVSLIDRDRQWLKSALGLDATETPRDIAFCAHTILQPELMIVPDAQSDPRFSGNPQVTGNPGIRFYAGVPLRVSSGLALGSLCVIDKKPRWLSLDQQAALRVLARQVVSQLELKRHIAAQEQLIAERLEAECQLQAEIAERRWAESELERILLQNAQVLASISSILIGVDADGLVSTWNAAASRAFSLRTPEVLGQRFLNCGIQWDWKSVHAAVQRCEREQAPVQLENVSFCAPDGTEHSLGITLTPIIHHSDEPQGFLLLAADITQRRIMEGQLATAQKLESIGQLASGIAHEINTPVQYVGDNLRFLHESMNDLRPLLDLCRTSALPEIALAAQDADLEYLQEEIPKAAAQAQEGISRVSHIIRAMKEFSHPGTTQKAAADLNSALESTLTVARNEWKYVANLVTDFDPSLPLIPCLAAEMNQVFLNMIVNAAHAIGDVVGDGSLGKGTITVRTRLLTDCVEISISDTGCGMTDQVKARIFDPFFTTKSVGRGTGQGLAISHMVVVEKHGGRIAVETAPGRGTRFIIHLPIAEAGQQN